MTEPTRLQTPDGRSLDLYLAGPSEGTPLVFICGTPGSGMPFRPFVDALADRGMRYVGWSRPGYGSSTRQPDRGVADFVTDTATVLDHLGAERCHVLGWSGGGPHALACAALLPERVDAVATIGSVAPWPAEGLDWMAGMGEENIEEFSASLESPEALIAFKERNWPIFSKITAQEVADAFGDLIDDVDRAALTGEFSEWMAAVLREGLREGYWGWFDDDMAFIRPWGFDLAAIRVPVHLWQGAHDRMVPYAHGEWLAAHVRGACPHLFPEHGHLTLAVDALPQILDELIGRPG